MIVYAKVVSCVDVKDYSCDRCIFYDCYKDTGCHRGGVGGALG